MKWYDLRFSNSETPNENAEFYFDRDKYEKELARIVSELDGIGKKSEHIQSELDNA